MPMLSKFGLHIPRAESEQEAGPGIRPLGPAFVTSREGRQCRNCPICPNPNPVRSACTMRWMLRFVEDLTVSFLPTWATNSWVPTRSRKAPRSRARLGSHSSSRGRYPESVREFLWAVTFLMMPVTGTVSALAVAEHWNATNPTEQVNLHPIPNATNYPLPHPQPSKKPIGQNPTCWLDRNPAWPDC